MNFVNLKVDVVDRICRVTINRPDKLNALNQATIAELDRAVEAAVADPEVWAIIVTGAGDKSFVAGADIQELNGLEALEARTFARRGQMVFSRLEQSAKPTLAAVNGFALGGGCELAMACHLRIASSNAVFGQPEVKLGLIPGYGGTQRLPRLVGRGVALELLLTGRNVKAEEAQRIGLVNQVVEPDQLLGAAEKMLSVILANGPTAVGLCVDAVNRGIALSLEQGCALEADLFAVGASSPEMAEGTQAFLEKRPASFR